MQKMSDFLSTQGRDLHCRIDEANRPAPKTGAVTTTGSLAVLAVAAAIVMPVLTWMPGCSDPSSNYANIEYVMGEMEPGTPILNPEAVIDISNKLGFAVSLNQVNKSLLEYSETVPPELLRGKQTFESMNYVKSKALRLTMIKQPEGTRIVQVDVSLRGELPLKTMQSSASAEWNPAPVVHDNLGQFYHPIGYILKSDSGKSKTTIAFEPGKPIKDLRQLPVLSRSKPENLKLLFRVNEGVKLTGYSYAGKDVRTFDVAVS